MHAKNGAVRNFNTAIIHYKCRYNFTVSHFPVCLQLVPLVCKFQFFSNSCKILWYFLPIFLRLLPLRLFFGKLLLLAVMNCFKIYHLFEGSN